MSEYIACAMPSCLEEKASLQRDAERYRWLRSQTNCRVGTTFQFPTISTLAPHEQNTYAARFDACIDAAMEAGDA